MMIFFARNLYLTQKKNMDSWMGGGMRMFAEIDKSLNRVVLLETITLNEERKYSNLNEIEKIEDEVMSLKILPSIKKSQILRKMIKEDKFLLNQLGIKKDSIVEMRIIVNRVHYLAQTKKLIFMEIYRDENNSK